MKISKIENPGFLGVRMGKLQFPVLLAGGFLERKRIQKLFF